MLLLFTQPHAVPNLHAVIFLLVDKTRQTRTFEESFDASESFFTNQANFFHKTELN